MKDGGPAFPVECNHTSDGRIVGVRTGSVSGWETGMSLRDYFAAKALQGCLAYSVLNESWGDYHNNSSKEGLARHCYDYADAMLAARSPQDTSHD